MTVRAYPEPILLKAVAWAEANDVPMDDPRFAAFLDGWRGREQWELERDEEAIRCVVDITAARGRRPPDGGQS